MFRNRGAMSIVLTVAVGAATSVFTVSPLAATKATAEDSDTRGKSMGSDEVILESWRRLTRSLGGGEGRSPDTSPTMSLHRRDTANSAQRICPPTLYTFGTEREVIFECDGAGGTELTPFFDRAEGEEVDPEDVRAQPIVITREDVQSLFVTSGSLDVQPGQSWVLVNTDTVVMTDAVEHVLGTEVLDLDVDVRVTPVLFSWDFGDGSVPVTGTDPGAPWPDHTVWHVYREAGEVTISLRTEWDAAFRVEGTSTWIPVTGRAVTTASTDSIEVVTATPRLTAG